MISTSSAYLDKEASLYSEALVTGGTGFIGRYVVRHLLDLGIRVRVLTRRPAKAEQLFRGRVDIIEGELMDREALDRACQGVQFVYHVAGLYCFGWKNREALDQTNREGTHLLLQAARKARVDGVVHVSSAGILGGSNRVLTENDFSPINTWGCHYKNSKRQSEKVAMDWAKKGLPVVIVNPSCPIGAEDEEPTPTGRMVVDFLAGKFPFKANTGLNFLSVKDLAEGIVLAGKRGTSGERYILGGENLWLGEFLDLLASRTGKAAPRHALPWGVILMAGLGGEAIHYLSRSKNVHVCLETAQQARRVQFFSTERAKRELGWTASTPLTVCVDEAIHWIQRRESGQLPESLLVGEETHAG
jgi:dihydroflavonol-4-reductase